mmetsp:Transcript_47677/g.147565  ORF Transcript_47677/g.147565 Transcript_47677/m.147565 type:complete len:206 (-) Transcript_47677:651-1268(-)
MRRSRSSLIIFFTFLKGSSATRPARIASTRLSSCLALRFRNSTALAWYWLCKSARNDANEWPFCRSEGRCFPALPLTASLPRISIAFSIATSSSARNCCRASNSEAFCSQVEVTSARYFLSASFTSIVSSKSPLASAFFSRVEAFISAFLPLSSVAESICAFRSCMSRSKACWAAISFFSRSVRSWVNLLRRLSSIVMMPLDWKS